ncbi:MAG: nuclear transport factor 2 family protein, partial [Pseudomonadota bacterium]|nr:nuclear transport factor 2 family protein [Pseudomonadota bacterium]
MSIIEKLGQAIDQKNESAMNELLHDDYKFTMHSNGAVLTKQDVIGWAMSDDI